MSTDIPPVGAAVPTAYITPKRQQQERRRTPPKKPEAEPAKDKEPEQHDGIDCYT